MDGRAVRDPAAEAALETDREAVRRDVASRSFLDFAAGRGRPGEERTVAVLGADRARLLGLAGRAAGAIALRLSAGTVATHPRFAGFGTEDWRRVQRIADEGEWAKRGSRHRLMWIEEDGKPWLVVAKRAADGGVYLQSYRRVERRKFRKLKREGLDTGGP